MKILFHCDLSRVKTIEECVSILSKYRKKIQEYQIDLKHVRTVATSAVREADNRLLFIDRVFVSTGFEVHILDDAEIHRLMYMGILPSLSAQMTNVSHQTLLFEIGGGNTEVILLNGRDVAYSHAFRLGSLRLVETLENINAPDTKHYELMESQIRNAFYVLPENINKNQPLEMIAMGGEIRLAASKLQPDAYPQELSKIPIVSLENFARRLSLLSVEEIARSYHLSYLDAETFAPAIMTYCMVANLLEIKHLRVSHMTLRDGILTDMATHDTWSAELEQQVTESAMSVARRYDVDEKHAVHVADTSHQLFNQLAELHKLETRHARLLYISSLLHECGLYVSNFAYHKHSYYLISHSEIFGLSNQDLHIISLVVRYHRRSPPKSTHTTFMALPRDLRIIVVKLASILRISIALDASRNQSIDEFSCRVEGHRMIIDVQHTEDLTNEKLALRQSSTMFEDIYGLKLHLRPHLQM